MLDCLSDGSKEDDASGPDESNIAKIWCNIGFFSVMVSKIFFLIKIKICCRYFQLFISLLSFFKDRFRLGRPP